MNFALILFTAMVLTGAVSLWDRWFFAKHRASDAKPPLLIEYSKSFFPVILAVFVLRSFLVEPFKIPSGSMLPTLQVGDFILVNKYEYGIRLPIVNKKIIPVSEPQRGDVMVFRFPRDEGLDYIKRVVGLPGDVIEYRNKQLSINDRPVAMAPAGEYDYVGGGLNFVQGQMYRESLGQPPHLTMIQAGTPSVITYQVLGDFPFRDQCKYDLGFDSGFRCTVPAGHYFMMGDNRDASNDSRYWGFVPDRNIVGRAFYVWWNFDDFMHALRELKWPERIGKRIAAF